MSNTPGIDPIDAAMLTKGYARVTVAARAAGMSQWMLYRWIEAKTVKGKATVQPRRRYVQLASLVSVLAPAPPALRALLKRTDAATPSTQNP